MNKRLLILADGALGIFSSKTATSLLRYRGDEVVGVLDREHAGRTTREVLGVPAAVPIVGTMAEALKLNPDTLVLGIAPPGGGLPDHWREVIRAALEAGLSVFGGLHVFLAEDPEFSDLARKHGGIIRDFRKPPEDHPIGLGRARETRALRLLTVGTDCSVGKMVASLELAAAARRRDLDTRFVATGQTGMMISGGGLTIDRVPGDFMAGFVEKEVVAAGDADVVVVEGQGCLLHPAYSGVTLALLHGTLPDAMVLVHHAGRDTIRYTNVPIPPLADWVRRYEDVVAPIHPGKVVGIAINPSECDPAEAAAVIRRAEDETGLPVVDVVSEGADRLLEAALELRR
jgi:uncharacterized NAD-dependent epimerase/dehydratase family protein